jgi:hypothetical protein
MNDKSRNRYLLVLGLLAAGLVLGGILLAAAGSPASAQGQTIAHLPVIIKKACNGPGSITGKVVDATTKQPPLRRPGSVLGGAASWRIPRPGHIR